MDDFKVITSELAFVIKEKKQLEDKEKKLKEELQTHMTKFNIPKFEDEFCKVISSKESETKTIDVKALEEKEPELYGDLIKDYPKVTKRAGGIRVTVK